jgi:hypothetical protein
LLGAKKSAHRDFATFWAANPHFLSLIYVNDGRRGWAFSGILEKVQDSLL